MINCPCRKMIVEKSIEDVKFYDDCIVRAELLKLTKYRYYKALYEGRIKQFERIINNRKYI